VDTQLRGVEEPGIPPGSGLSFQDIGGLAGIEYNNIAYDPVTRFLYAVQITPDPDPNPPIGSQGGNRGLVRIGLDPTDPTQLTKVNNNPVAPWGGDGNDFPRYDAGDIDPEKREFYVMVTSTTLGSTCTGATANPSVCLGRVIAFDIDMLPAPGDGPADLAEAFSTSRVFGTTSDPNGPAISNTSGGRVADWAFKDGKLYGGNAVSGQLSVITPNLGIASTDPRPVFENFNFVNPATDPTAVASALDITTAGEADAYGAAFFIDHILHLYRNGGNNNGTPKVFKIDLQIDPITGDPNPKIIEIVEGVDQVNRNDGASFMAQGSEPFVCTDTAYLVQADGQQSRTDINCVDTSCPTTLSYIDQTAVNFNIVDIANTGVDEINAIGYNTLDNFLYGVQVQLDPVFGTFPWTNQGIVRIAADGTVTNLGNPTSMTETWPSQSFNAGDVMPGTNTLYVHLNGGAGGDNSARRLYIVDLATMTFTSKEYSGETSNPEQVVLDWAAHPTNGLLYGADRQGQIAVLDPNDASGFAVRTDGPNPGLASFPNTGSDGYGAAWFNSAGELFVYQNSGTIYKIDLGDCNPFTQTDSSGAACTFTPAVVGLPQSGDPTTRNDGAACAAEVEPAPAIEIQKTVYWGHDSGASAASAGELVISENSDPVTYVFTVTNTGNTHLSSIMIDDALLSIVDSSGLSLLSGSEPLAPGESLVFYYETTINGDVMNTAMASGNPVDEQGEDIPDLQDPTDEDTAEVQEAASGIEIQKTVYAGHDSGGSAPGDELVIGADGSAVTYVFTVTNTGASPSPHSRHWCSTMKGSLVATW
jgi:hypothetical protein